MKNISAQSYFSNLLEEAKKRVNAFPESKTKKLKESLEHGLAELRTEDEMDIYLASYGAIHQEKLLMALDKLPRKIMRENRISVIDYGCGQGTASIVLCDVFQQVFGCADTVSDFHLIEPSLVCLRRAVNFIHQFNPEARIVYFNNPCEDIWRMDLNPKSDVVVHLFSNVIDMPEFPRESVARKLNNMNDHYNIAICVSPFYQENGRAKHMDEFRRMLHTFNCHYAFEKHTDEWDKPYSCQARVFVSRYY